ncbi:GAF domain-containing protein [Streptomyces roseoverticillatus]|uniref:GAF domain-containing sensor histidine kinase n=1 Tax=Streptomyces roseoverticillatus TaxID=66429 RepID=UPI0033E18B98
MRGLLDAVMSIGHGLELPQVLHGIVEAAVTLTDAEYGALGIVGDGQTLSEFLPVGMSEELTARIGRTPCGRGILGELIHNPAPLRLTDLTRHPRSYGFPDHHPPMRTFLGVPVRVRNEVFGNLYLTEKRGGAAFDADDEAVLTTLSIAAGVAIDNARMYHESRRRERWLQALGEITRSLLSGTDADAALKLIAERAMEVGDADSAVVAGPDDCVGLDDGADHDDVAGHDGVARHDDQDGGGRKAPDGQHGPTLSVPLQTADGARGALRLRRRAGRPPFDESEVKLISGFADQAAIALELAQRRAESEELAVLHDRDRIARDLHDLAIQRLFATGMTLQSATRLIDRPEAAERVGRAVDDLDTTIQIIRSTIFGLRTAGDGRGGGPSLRRGMAEAVQAATRTLGFAPALRIEGPADTDVPAELAEQILAVVAEALSNAARHAAARRVEVMLTVAERATLTVTDDGVGVGSAPRRGGLANMRSRAELHDGRLAVETPEGGGTRIVWSVPLPE